VPAGAGTSGGQIAVRPPRLEDVDELARINIAAWRSAYAGIVPDEALAAMELEDYRLRWRRNVSGEHPRGASILVALLGGTPTSYVIFGPYRTQQDAEPGEDTAGWSEIYAIYTDPERQGNGAGTAVHDAALTALAAASFTEAALWVLADNVPAQEWYFRRGWYADGATSMWTEKGTSLPEVRLRHQLG
jgi:ribosomal protein S18 acetylase RimI-like enzyme